MKELLPFSEQIVQLLRSPVLLACFFSWVGCQVIKTTISLIYGRIHSFIQLIETMIWNTGGMPSSHSAVVTALCTTIGFRHGFHSDIFIFSLFFAFITIRDAFGVRRATGLQAKKLNQLGKELSDKSVIQPYKPMKEVLGHTPMEVLCGCFMGFFVALSFSLL